MQPDLVKVALDAALKDLVRDHRELLNRNVNEHNISQHLAILLGSKFADFAVDCEYNLDIDDASGRKRVYGANSARGTLATPDVIVHRRGMNGSENNILAVELKKHGVRAPSCDHDRRKLCHYTAIDGRNHLGFLLGALVVVGVDRRAGEYRIDWFAGGRPQQAEDRRG